MIPHLCTCGIRLAVVLTTILHLYRRQAEGLDHLVSALTPVGGAESQDGEGQSQSGQGQGEQGARATGHMLQHGHAREDRGRGRLERWKEREGREGVTVVPNGGKRVGQMLWDGFKS